MWDERDWPSFETPVLLVDLLALFRRATELAHPTIIMATIIMATITSDRKTDYI